MVHSEEGHLTGFVEQVGEGDEGVGFLQVQDENCSDEGHALDLDKHTRCSDTNQLLHISVHQRPRRLIQNKDSLYGLWKPGGSSSHYGQMC